MLNFSQFAIFFLFLGYVLISVLFLFLFCFVLRSLAVQIKATTIPDSVLNCNFGRKQSEPALVSDLSLSVLTPLKSLRNTEKGIHVGRSDGNMIARREAFRLDVKRSQCQALSHVRPSRRFRLGLGFTAGLIWGAGLLRRRNLNTEVSLWECIKCFPSTIRRKDLRKGQSTVILD